MGNSYINFNNSNFNKMGMQLNSENLNLALAEIDFPSLQPNSRSSIMSLGSSLHEIGTDVAPQGQNDFFTALVVESNQYGQAILASFREGRNLKQYDVIGIGSDTQIPSSTV